MPLHSGVTNEPIKFDRRKEAVKYPHTTYIRLLKPGDVFYIQGERNYGCEQVEVAPKPFGIGMTEVKLYGRNKKSRFANWDRCVIVFRYKENSTPERLV